MTTRSHNYTTVRLCDRATAQPCDRATAKAKAKPKPKPKPKPTAAYAHRTAATLAEFTTMVPNKDLEHLKRILRIANLR